MRYALNRLLLILLVCGVAWLLYGWMVALGALVMIAIGEMVIK